MNEEEKKAIERMTKVRDKNVHTFVDELTIILNLIEKQDQMIKDMALNIKELADLDYSIKEIIENFERKFK